MKSMRGLPLVLNVKRLVDKCPLKERKVFFGDIHTTHDFLIFVLAKLSGFYFTKNSLGLYIRQLLLFLAKKKSHF